MATNMHHYVESGLDNVWLSNGFTVKETPYGRAVSVHHADKLDRSIALALVRDKGPALSGKEFRFLRALIGLSQAAFGKTIDVKEQTVSLWERNDRVPRYAALQLQILVLGMFARNTKIGEIVDKAKTVDRLVNAKIVLTESKSAWQAKLQALPKPKVAKKQGRTSNGDELLTA